MKNVMQAETAEAEISGVKVKINGGFTVEDIFISAEAMNGDLAKNLKYCFNDAVSKMQASMAQKFSGMMG